MPLNMSFSGPRNRLLFWSLVVLAIAMILAVAFALRGFNREMDKDSSPSNSPGMSKDDVKDVPLSEAMTEDILMGWKRDERNHVSVTGEVVSVFPIPEQKEVKGVEVQLLVSSVVDPSLYPAPDKVYLYFLSERDTEGFYDTIATDDTVTITSLTDPTDEGYVIGTKVEKEEGMKEDAGMMKSE